MLLRATALASHQLMVLDPAALATRQITKVCNLLRSLPAPFLATASQSHDLMVEIHSNAHAALTPARSTLSLSALVAPHPSNALALILFYLWAMSHIAATALT
jgi:hypothetical protein